MYKKLLLRLKNSRASAFFIKASRKAVLPGFGKVPLFNVSVLFINGLRKGDITLRASAMAFNFFLAIFPFIIFLFTLIPYVPIDHFQERLISLIESIMPSSAFRMIESTLQEILTKQNGGLLSFGFISALYFSTNGIVTMMQAFNSSYHSVENRKPLQQRLVAVLLIFILTFSIISAISILVYSEFFLQSFRNQPGWVYFLIMLGRILVLLGLCFCIISFIYYLGPSRKSGWKFISAGSTLSTLLCIITSLGFAFYVNNFGQYNKLYGSIGTLLVILLWIYLNSLVLLLGFELNASIHSAKRSK